MISLLLLAIAPQAAYSVTFDAASPLIAHVAAHVPIQGGDLHTGEGAIDQIPRGWASFVRNLSVSQDGHSVRVQPTTTNHWHVDGHDGLAILKYDVDLGYARSKWPPGNEQAGIVMGDQLFTVTKPIFIASADVPSNVSIGVPRNWKIATPWMNTNGVYHVRNQEDLLVNTFVVGNFAEHELKAGRFEFQIVLLGKASKDADALMPALTRVARFYVKMIPDTPSGRYLVTFFYADAEDGESYAQSSAFTSNNPLTKETALNWGNNLAHELFHFWNGHLIQATPEDDMAWFTEGFTEYFANKALLNSGAIGEKDYLRKVERHVSNYMYWRASAAFKNGSLRKAGAQKGIDRFAVYDGGWSMALWLDIHICERSQGKYGLGRLMASIFSRFGATSNRLKLSDFLKTVEEFAGHDAMIAASTYVEGKRTIPLEDVLHRVGIEGSFQDYADEIYLFEEPHPSAKMRAVRAAWLK